MSHIMIWTLLKLEFVTIQMKTIFFLIDTNQTKLSFPSGIINCMLPCASLKKQHLWYFAFVRDLQIQE